MSQSLETWWTVNYSNYSLSDLSVFPIYQRMAKTLYPFRRELGGVSEGYESELETDSYYWNDADMGRREKLSHNRKTKEYTYELQFTDGKKTTVVTSRKQGTQESGEVRKIFGAWELVEGWAYVPPAKEYSRYSLENGIRKGMKTGVTADGERWLIEEWFQPDESTYKKTYEKEGLSGGESLCRKGTHSWGQQWLSSTDSTEVKTWEELPGRRWGQSSSKHPRGHSSLHQYDFSDSVKKEERLSTSPGKVLGYRYRQAGVSWLKEEWENTDVLEAQRSEFDLITAQLRLQLGKLCGLFKRTLREAGNTLVLLRDKETSGRVPAILIDIEDLPETDASTLETMVHSLEAVADITHRAEMLTQSILTETDISDKLHAEGDSQEGKIREMKAEQKLDIEERESEKRQIALRESEQQRKIAELEAAKQRLLQHSSETQQQLDHEIALRTAAQLEIAQLKQSQLESEQRRMSEAELRNKADSEHQQASETEQRSEHEQEQRAKPDQESQFKKIAEQVTERIKTLERELERRKAMDREADHKRSIEREAEKRTIRDAESRANRLEKQLKDAKQEVESLRANLPKPENPRTVPSSQFLIPKASPRNSPKRRASAIVSSDLVTTNSDLVKQVALLKAELSALKGSPAGRRSPQPGDIPAETSGGLRARLRSGRAHPPV